LILTPLFKRRSLPLLGGGPVVAAAPPETALETPAEQPADEV
jgi:hypothetical protein